VDIENFCQAQAAVNVDAHSSRFAGEAQAAVNFDDYSGKSVSGWSDGRVRACVRCADQQ